MEKITCPNCSHKFDIENALASELKKEFDQKLKEEKSHLFEDRNKLLGQLEAEKKSFEEKKKKENQLFAERLSAAKSQQALLLKKELEEGFANQIKLQNEELNRKSEKLKNLQTVELELMRTQKKLGDVETQVKLKLERKFLLEQKENEERISKQIREEENLKILEKDKQLEDQRKLIEEMRRKSEQGSQQLQGEIQELAIENLLKAEFPFDDIKEVPKGVRGADTIQVVMNKLQQNCGKIIYESKRTKAFGGDWIDKLKADQRLIGADIAVLVSAVLPKDMERFGQKNGVWICTFQEFKSLSHVLRAMLLRVYDAKASQENKGDKMEHLYHYLTGPEFRMQITGIVDAFQNLKEELDKEKRAMAAIWKRREKQIDMVVDNTANLYGSIRGIAGKAIPTVQQFELPEGDEE